MTFPDRDYQVQVGSGRSAGQAAIVIAPGHQAGVAVTRGQQVGVSTDPESRAQVSTRDEQQVAALNAGQKGLKGDKGDKGDRGDAGPPGPAAMAAIQGTISQLPPGGQFTGEAWIVNGELWIWKD